MHLKSLFHAAVLSIFLFLAGCSTSYVTPIPEPVDICQNFEQKQKVIKSESCTAIDYDRLFPERKSIWGKKSLFWQPGSTLKVAFVDGTQAQRNLMWSRFETIQSICNIKFEKVEIEQANSNIRVSFDHNSGGHWSYLGVQNNRIPKFQKTMNISLDSTDRGEEWDRVAQHEILHALGFHHELQHPYADIPWDREKVYAYYEKSQGWNRAQVDAQILNRATPDDFTGSEFDSFSIMAYPVSPELTKNGFSIGWNFKLSACDLETIRSIYHQ